MPRYFAALVLPAYQAGVCGLQQQIIFQRCPISVLVLAPNRRNPTEDGSRRRGGGLSSRGRDLLSGKSGPSVPLLAYTPRTGGVHRYERNRTNSGEVLRDRNCWSWG